MSKKLVRRNTLRTGVEIKKAVVIGVTDYSELRKVPGKEAFSDINEAARDVQVVKQGLRHLGFIDDDVISMMNPTRKKVKETFSKVMT